MVNKSIERVIQSGILSIDDEFLIDIARRDISALLSNPDKHGEIIDCIFDLMVLERKTRRMLMTAMSELTKNG